MYGEWEANQNGTHYALNSLLRNLGDVGVIKDVT